MQKHASTKLDLGHKADAEPADELLTSRQVCHHLKISRTTLWQLRRKGHLPTIYLGGRIVRFRKRDVEALMDQTTMRV